MGDVIPFPTQEGEEEKKERGELPTEVVPYARTVLRSTTLSGGDGADWSQETLIAVAEFLSSDQATEEDKEYYEKLPLNLRKDIFEERVRPSKYRTRRREDP